MSTATAAVLSFSPIARDRRVLRQCALLADMGHPPLVIGYARPGETIPFPFVSRPPPMPTAAHRLSTLARQLPASLGTGCARAGFWAASRHRWALARLRAARPGLVVANDWPALVVAAAYKAGSGSRLLYDTHEFATLEFDERRWWRVVYKPFVTRLEQACFGAADVVTTVGPMLAAALRDRYHLAVLPGVVRNIPDRIALPNGSVTEWPLRVLYHGQVLPDRGLEELIDSVALWREPHRLTIRGDGDPGYLASLRRRAAATGRAALIRFEPAVPPGDVMPLAARSADLGVHFTPLETRQRHFSLPNKLFEYIGAGLAVAVSPGADLKQIVEEHGVGVVSAGGGAAAAAAAINGLDREQVAAFRARAREAAGVLCWEREREVPRVLIRSLLARLPEVGATE